MPTTSQLLCLNIHVSQYLLLSLEMWVLEEQQLTCAVCHLSAHSLFAQAEPWFQGGAELVATRLLTDTLYTCTEWEHLAAVFCPKQTSD